VAGRRGRKAATLAIGVLLAGLAGATAGLAQEAGGENKLDRAFFGRFKHDFTGVITAPAKWSRSDLLTLAAVSGTGLLLMAYDQKIQDWVQSQRTGSSASASSIFTIFGNGAFLLGLSAAIYTAGEIGHDDGLRKTALLSLESLTTAGLLAWTMKFVFGRARPYSGESSHSFTPFTLAHHHFSFPSGHATAAFSVATTIALRSKSLFVDIAAYSLACLAGISRSHDNYHWASDIFVGSVLGYFVARKIVDLNRPGSKKTISLGFQNFRGRQAITLSIGF